MRLHSFFIAKAIQRIFHQRHPNSRRYSSSASTNSGDAQLTVTSRLRPCICTPQGEHKVSLPLSPKVLVKRFFLTTEPSHHHLLFFQRATELTSSYPQELLWSADWKQQLHGRQLLTSAAKNCFNQEEPSAVWQGQGLAAPP